MRFINPFEVQRNLRNVRSLASGGGPKVLRLVRVGELQGLVVPSSEVVIEVERKDGTKVQFDPEVPLPFVFGWAVRLARRLGVPLISSLDPKDLSFEITLPR